MKAGYLESGELELPSTEAGATTMVGLPGAASSVQPGAGETWLTVRFLTREALAWAPAGFEVGWGQVQLAAGPAPPARNQVGGPPPVDDAGNLIHELLAASPRLALWRAPTDNDTYGGIAAPWSDWGLAELSRTVTGMDRNDGTATVRSDVRTAAGIVVAS